MKQLSALKTLAEAGGLSKASQEAARRAWFKRAGVHLDALDQMVNGKVLPKLLADGEFPATESKAMIAAWKEFMEQHLDLMMGMLQEFDDE
jgi:hypothetical protein